MTAAGTKLFDGALVMANAAGVGDEFKLHGHPHWPIFLDSWEHRQSHNRFMASRTYKTGVLILTTFKICAAH